MKQLRQKWLALCALFLSLASLKAALLVGPDGTGIQTFSSQPPVENWSTMTGSGVPADITSAAALETAIQLINSVDIFTALGSSGTTPPSTANIARRNTNLQVIQSRPNNSTAYVLLMATLQNDTGATARYLRINYDFGLAIATDSSAVEEVPGFRGYYSLTGVAGSWQPIWQFNTGTTGAVTATLDLGSWAAGAPLYLMWADDDAASHDTAPSREGAWTIDNFEARVVASKEPVFKSFTSSATGFVAEIENGSAPTTVNQDSIRVTFNGETVTPTIASQGGVITVSLNRTLAAGSENSVSITFLDNNTPPREQTFARTFTVAPYNTIPASYAVSGVDTTSSGFRALVHQIPAARSPGDRNSIFNAEKQLANQFEDPLTGEPYRNIALAPGTPDGRYLITDTINWNQDAPTATGVFSNTSNPPREDTMIPGIPGELATNDDIVAEVLTFLELKAGVAYRMAVNSDDGFKVTVGPNPRDQFALVLGSFNTGRGVATTTFDFVVEQDGIYPFRLLWWEGNGGAALEWFTINPNGEAVLINDRQIASAVKAYSDGPTLPPFVQFISPANGETNAPANLTIDAIIVDGSTEVQSGTVQLYVANQLVNATVTKEGDVTTVMYDPPGDLPAETVLPIRLVYGDDGSPAVTRTNEWTVKVKAQVLVALDETTMWKYDRSNTNLGTEWREKAYNDSAWLEGAALLGVESDVTVEPMRTPFASISTDEGVFITTHYFRHKFNFNGNPAAVNLVLRHVIDDGAVFYLNGVEIHRFGFAAGVEVNHDSLASSNEQTWRGPYNVSKASLVNGENVLAVEVHQTSIGSSDIVFGMELQVVNDPNAGPAVLELISPAPDSIITEQPTIEFRLLDGVTMVNRDSIKLTINGSVVQPTITKEPGSISTLVSYTPQNPFANESTVAVKFEFADTAFPANTVVREFVYTVRPITFAAIDESTLWKYDRSNIAPPPEWKNYNFDDSQWGEGASLLGVESDATVAPMRTRFPSINTEFGEFIVTHYFRHKFNYDGNPAALRMQLRHVVDDGVVIYLNGIEIHRFGFNAGVAVTHESLSSGNEQAWRGPYDIPKAALRRGQNILAAEVHQTSIGSSDIVFGLELLAFVDPNVGPAQVVSFTPAEGANNEPNIPVVDIMLEDGTTTVVPSSVKLRVNGQVVTPNVDRPANGILTRVTWSPSVAYPPETPVSVTLEFTDSAGATTVVDRSFVVAPTFDLVFGIDLNQQWKYSNTGEDLGAGWRAPGYNDSAWPSGPALLAAETGATAAEVWTPLSRVAVDGVTQIVTDYFRTRFTFNGNPANTRMRIRHVVDDGVVIYLNGQEIHRFGIAPETEVIYSTTAADHENRWEGPFWIDTSALVQGENVIAAEVHQTGPDSSDAVFGMELQLVTSEPIIVEEPEITSIALDGGNVRINWTGGGVLEASPAVGPNADWQAVNGVASPATIPASGDARFFRIRK